MAALQMISLIVFALRHAFRHCDSEISWISSSITPIKTFPSILLKQPSSIVAVDAFR